MIFLMMIDWRNWSKHYRNFSNKTSRDDRENNRVKIHPFTWTFCGTTQLAVNFRNKDGQCIAWRKCTTLCWSGSCKASEKTYVHKLVHALRLCAFWCGRGSCYSDERTWVVINQIRSKEGLLVRHFNHGSLCQSQNSFMTDEDPQGRKSRNVSLTVLLCYLCSMTTQVHCVCFSPSFVFFFVP